LSAYPSRESRDDALNWRNTPDSGYVQFNLRDLLNAGL
jgi:hypothetical protein